MNPRPARTLTLIFASLLLLPPALSAQHREVPPPAAYAIEGVTVVWPDLREEAGATVIVRGKLIESIGAGVEIPADAKKLEGDSLYLYPGLIDADGAAEFEFPEKPEEGPPSWAPTRIAQGLTPHRRVVDYLTGTGESQSGQRQQGIVAAGVHPEGGLAPGRSAVVLNRVKGPTSRSLVAREDAGTVMAFQTAQGVYPVTLLGVMATIRQAFADAERHQAMETAYAAGTSGVTMPEWDPDFEVLRAAASGSIPVFFRATSGEDVRRVLGLTDELGIRPVILGGDEASEEAEALAARGIPVLIDTDFPEPDEWDPESEEELEPAAWREKERLERLYSNAATLEAAGVRIALTSGGGDANLLEGARKTVEYGLSNEAAITALTRSPADILGVPSLIDYGAGRPATFILTTGPLLAEDTEIAYTFVDGAYEEGAASGAAGEAPTVTVTGSWEVEISAQGMSIPMEVELEQEGATFTGSATAEMFGSASIRSGRVSGNKVRFRMIIAAGGQNMEVDLEGTVEGDSMSGSGSSPMGDFTFEGKRNPGGAR